MEFRRGNSEPGVVARTRMLERSILMNHVDMRTGLTLVCAVRTWGAVLAVFFSLFVAPGCVCTYQYQEDEGYEEKHACEDGDPFAGFAGLDLALLQRWGFGRRGRCVGGCYAIAAFGLGFLMP